MLVVVERERRRASGVLIVDLRSPSSTNIILSFSNALCLSGRDSLLVLHKHQRVTIESKLQAEHHHHLNHRLHHFDKA